MSGSTRRSNTSPPPRNGPKRRERRLAALVAGRGRGDVRYVAVHGQGQRRLPRRQLPGHPVGWLGRAVEDGRPAEGLQLGSTTTAASSRPPPPRRLHGRGAGDPAGRLLALVSDRQRAGERRHSTSPERFASRREQGSRRRARQFCQPRRPLLRARFDGRVPGEGERPASASTRCPHEIWHATSRDGCGRHHEALEFRRRPPRRRAPSGRARTRTCSRPPPGPRSIPIPRAPRSSSAPR